MIDGIDYENALYNNDFVDVYTAARSLTVCYFFKACDQYTTVCKL